MMHADSIWRGKSDEEVLAAAGQIGDFTDEGQQILTAEVERRGLTVSAPPVSIGPSLSFLSDPQPSSVLGRLWAGGYSLPLSYWGWGVAGSIVWRTVAALVFTLAPAGLFRPAAALFLLFVYLAFAVVVGVAIWRSADRYTGRPAWAVLAKVAVAANASALVMRLIFVFLAPAS